MVTNTRPADPVARDEQIAQIAAGVGTLEAAKRFGLSRRGVKHALRRHRERQVDAGGSELPER